MKKYTIQPSPTHYLYMTIDGYYEWAEIKSLLFPME
jgi:hypothetical protein